MNKVERVRAVLEGRMPDRPPVSFWHHFAPDAFHGQAAVMAHVNHLEAYDLDFLKVMNDNGYPHAGPVGSASDLASLGELRGDEVAFARQLDLISALRRTLHGRVPIITTIFNAWTTLRHLLRPPTSHSPPDMEGTTDEPSRRIKAMIREHPGAVERALMTIGRSLSRFAERCIQAGADGIYLSVRDDWLALPGERDDLYDRFVRTTDLEILRGASKGTFNMLHVCGKAIDFRAFAAYPVHAINWADREAGPSISDVANWVKPAICAGVDNLGTLPTGVPADVEHEVRDALRQAGSRPIMVCPGCTYDPVNVPVENLLAITRAARMPPLPSPFTARSAWPDRNTR